MSVLDREAYIAGIQKLIGDNNDDSSIKILEDFTDTFDARNETETTDWKTKYEENDKSWREKYKERFNDSTSMTQVKEEQKEDVVEDGKRITFEDLFKEREG